MIGLLINLLIFVLILAVVYWIATLILNGIGAPPMVLTIVQVLLALFFLIWLLDALGVAGSGHRGQLFYRY